MKNSVIQTSILTMGLTSKFLLNKNVFHNKNYNLIYYNKNKKIY
jgi:hypothetical protein